ncbi:hypothetical protein HanIR_Chr12g0569451 [Helianthus annuus]|nr:hypothetical protein HanIR_Chr12g0569451 [Helianthus annuus]
MRSIRKSISRLGGRLGRSSGNTLGNSRTTGTSFTPVFPFFTSSATTMFAKKTLYSLRRYLLAWTHDMSLRPFEGVSP